MFEQPIAATAVVSLENFSLAELMKIPGAWDIVVKYLPALRRMVAAPMIQPHLGTFTVRTVEAFLPGITPEVLATIDGELRQLPPVKEPAL